MKAVSGKTFPVLNPANGKLLRTVPSMSSHEVQLAIASAKTNQEAWAKTPANERAGVIRRWADTIRENQEALAQLITAENGKTISDARVEVSASFGALEWYAEEAKRTYGSFVPAIHVTSRRQLIQHQPVGVVGVITPWNFPLAMITRKVGAAIAAGCAVVLKPAEDTPLSALALTQLALTSAQLPAGLLQIITASRDEAEQVGNTLCTNPDVRLIGFTGSTAVGKMLYTKAAAHGKRVLLELGGNAPFLVFQSANLDRAVAGAVACKFRCSGQVHNLVESAKTNGANAVVGGTLPNASKYAEGCFYPATVLADCAPNMVCVDNEIFGPVAPVIRFRSETEAIELANSTPYGLAAYLYTQEIRQAWHVAEQLQFGMIGVNSPRVSSIEMPFGGIKDSGIGREGGQHSLIEFMDVKTISWDLDPA
ncbi:succinate-semialdehyde dehydrogenase [Paragonimus westermani]|uniref:Succinate-semialdehyde dehydrogenase n=1 Tax=Paragonimus westermani TaxID=34504 RepID=A0A5J4NQ55_9TREM|nr:succinate-semialdehyde dehydrogenase [Paragonimus westermani]